MQTQHANILTSEELHSRFLHEVYQRWGSEKIDEVVDNVGAYNNVARGLRVGTFCSGGEVIFHSWAAVQRHLSGQQSHSVSKGNPCCSDKCRCTAVQL